MAVRGQGSEVSKKNLSQFAHCLILALIFLLPTAYCMLPNLSNGQDLVLSDLIDEALKNSPELLVSESRVSASIYKIPQAKSLPDPMFMFGYQNEGFSRFTLGDEPDAYGMFSLSQMFLFPGKRALERRDGNKRHGKPEGHAYSDTAEDRGHSQTTLL